MAEYFVGANVYERINWLFKKIDEQKKKIESAEREIKRLKETQMIIINDRKDENLALWFAKECGRRKK